VCVRVVLETVSFPDTLAPGTAAPLRLTTGLSFGGAAPVHAPPVFVTVQATGATPGLDAALAGAAGSVELPFTPSSTGPVRLEIRAALAEHGLAAFGIVRDTTIERAVAAAVTLTPTAAILDRGATATFTATLTGVATTAVTWTATGGTFVVAGNTLTYTAGSTPGTFAVTARSVADPTRSASAPVTIVGPSGGATVAVVGLRGESIATVAAGAITCTIQDTVATAAGIPGAEETRADCTGAVGGAALATGSYVLGGGASAALTISGEARTSASAGATDGQVSTVTRLRIRFTVGPDEVRLDLTGRLEAAIPDPASNTDATALLQLSGPGGTTVLRQEVGSSVVGGWVPPMSLAESRRLGPGTYELTVVVGNEARNGALTPSAGGTAAATFTLTFSR